MKTCVAIIYPLRGPASTTHCYNLDLKGYPWSRKLAQDIKEQLRKQFDLKHITKKQVPDVAFFYKSDTKAGSSERQPNAVLDDQAVPQDILDEAAQKILDKILATKKSMTLHPDPVAPLKVNLVFYGQERLRRLPKRLLEGLSQHLNLRYSTTGKPYFLGRDGLEVSQSILDDTAQQILDKILQQREYVSFQTSSGFVECCLDVDQLTEHSLYFALTSPKSRIRRHLVTLLDATLKINPDASQNELDTIANEALIDSETFTLVSADTDSQTAAHSTTANEEYTHDDPSPSMRP